MAVWWFYAKYFEWFFFSSGIIYIFISHFLHALTAMCIRFTTHLILCYFKFKSLGIELKKPTLWFNGTWNGFCGCQQTIFSMYKDYENVCKSFLTLLMWRPNNNNTHTHTYTYHIYCKSIIIATLDWVFFLFLFLCSRYGWFNLLDASGFFFNGFVCLRTCDRLIYDLNIQRITFFSII